MPKKNPFKEFVEGLSQLNGFRGDPDVKAIDEALAFWITKYYPEGFNFDYNRRNLLINMVKKAAKMSDLIKNSAFRPYIDALVNMKWLEIVKKETAKSKKTETDYYMLLLNFARDIFILGYCLKGLESKGKKPPEEEEKK